MRAIRWHARRDVRLEDIDDPGDPGPAEVVVEVDWCGICGTDVEEYQDGPLVIPTGPHPLTGYSAPMVIGHEVAGTISKVGRGVAVREGDKVALDGYLYCGTCRACWEHRVNLCDVWAHIGMSYPGGLAERMRVPAAMVLAAPDSVAVDALALAEPFSVAARAVRRGGVGQGHRIAVIGAGTIGLAVMQVAVAHGATDAVVIDPLTARTRLASLLGATGTTGSIDELQQTGEAGAFDVVFDCTGNAAVPDMAHPLVRPGGVVLLVGFPVQPSLIDLGQVLLREISLISTVGHVYDEDAAEAVRLIGTGEVDAAALITHRIPLERAVSGGIELLAGERRSEALKILVSPRHVEVQQPD